MGLKISASDEETLQLLQKFKKICQEKYLTVSETVKGFIEKQVKDAEHGIFSLSWAYGFIRRGENPKENDEWYFEKAQEGYDLVKIARKIVYIETELKNKMAKMQKRYEKVKIGYDKAELVYKTEKEKIRIQAKKYQ